MSPTILPIHSTISLNGNGAQNEPSPVAKPGTAGTPGNVAPPAGAPAPVVTTPAGSASPADPTDVVDIGLYAGANEHYAEVFDRRTHEMLRFIPPEALLKLHARLHQELGIKLDHKA